MQVEKIEPQPHPAENPLDDPPPRILVLSASVGAGHMRAAQAVELALRELAPEAVVRNIDILEMTNAAFRRIYGKAYLDLVNKAPHMLGFFYDILDKPRRQAHLDERFASSLPLACSRIRQNAGSVCPHSGECGYDVLAREL